jgi:hypothetical protein
MTSDRTTQAEILLKIFQIYSSEQMTEAFEWFHANFRAASFEEFQKRYPLGSKGRRHFFRIGNFFDLLGTFVERNLIPQGLFVDFCPDDVRSFWKSARNVILEGRERWNDPTLYRNLELLDKRIERWHKRVRSRRRGRGKT